MVRRDVQIARRKLAQIQVKQLARVATNPGNREAHNSTSTGKTAGAGTLLIMWQHMVCAQQHTAPITGPHGNLHLWNTATSAKKTSPTEYLPAGQPR